MADLRTDYVDDVLDTSKNMNRVYNFKDKTTGSIIYADVEIEDVTEYSQEGTRFGSRDMNATNKAVNTINTNLNNIDVYVGEDKKLHFVDASGADSALPFSGKPNYTNLECVVKLNITSSSGIDFDIPDDSGNDLYAIITGSTLLNDNVGDYISESNKHYISTVFNSSLDLQFGYANKDFIITKKDNVYHAPNASYRQYVNIYRFVE